MKNTAELLGNWNEIKGKLKQIFGKLMGSDVLRNEGKRQEIIGRLQVLVGQAKQNERRYTNL